MQSAASRPIPPRQIVLPNSVAVRIAYENIRMRLTRSLIATGGIILGVAFLISVMVSNVMIRGMRDWANQSPSSDPQFVSRFQQRQALQSLMKKNGVPITPQEISDDRIQTRWLLGLGLLVAFIGILNSMLMSVTERFREIGTMKCLGALDGFIVRLFLLESVFQGLAGTLIGIILGGGLSLLSETISYGSGAWQNVLCGELADCAGICFLVGMALTIGGAIYPAWQAARMQPIAAMRVET
jgi:ABC-type antimicrobial peptide transport system permease subunit